MQSKIEPTKNLNESGPLMVVVISGALFFAIGIAALITGKAHLGDVVSSTRANDPLAYWLSVGFTLSWGGFWLGLPVVLMMQQKLKKKKANHALQPTRTSRESEL